MFDSLNQNASLDYLEGQSLEELKKALLSINLPVNIISIYAFGSRHVAWFTTDAKIIKKTKSKKE